MRKKSKQAGIIASAALICLFLAGTTAFANTKTYIGFEKSTSSSQTSTSSSDTSTSTTTSNSTSSTTEPSSSTTDSTSSTTEPSATTDTTSTGEPTSTTSSTNQQGKTLPNTNGGSGGSSGSGNKWLPQTGEKKQLFWTVSGFLLLVFLTTIVFIRRSKEEKTYEK